MVNNKFKVVEPDDIFSDLLNIIDDNSLIQIMKEDVFYFEQFYYQYIKHPSIKLKKALKKEKELNALINQIEFDLFRTVDEETKIDYLKNTNQNKICYLLNKTDHGLITNNLLEKSFEILDEVHQYEVICNVIYPYFKKPSLKIQKDIVKNSKLSYIAMENLIKNENITEMQCFQMIINKNKNHLNTIKQSKYWKDDANLILEVINE